MPNIADGASHRTPLRLDRALLHAEGACLPLRSRQGQCQACAHACPVGALQVRISGVELGQACIGCGRCVAACPTEALMLPELEPLLATEASTWTTAQALRVECRKVPAASLHEQTMTLPCLGALRTGQLLALAASGLEVQVVDRGWCETCEAGCPQGATSVPATHPADAALDAARLWLEAVGSARMPRRVREALPLASRADAIAPPAGSTESLTRRSFFRAAVEKPAGRDKSAAMPMGSDGRAAYPADERRPSPERQRQLLAMQTLARGQGREVPPEFFARLDIGIECRDHRMCVALCPTGALTTADTAQATELRFDADHCIACGACQRACPEESLRLQPHGGGAGKVTLATHRQLACSACGDSYTAGQEPMGETQSGLCMACAKSHRFMDDARHQLFGGLN